MMAYVGSSAIKVTVSGDSGADSVTSCLDRAMSILGSPSDIEIVDNKLPSQDVAVVVKWDTG